MKKSALFLTIILISPIAYSADDVEESPPAVGCAGCSNNLSWLEEQYLADMNNAAAYAEAQRAMAAQREAEAKAKAQAEAQKQREQKAAQCKAASAGAATDLQECSAGLDYKANMMRNNCRDHGTVNWSFSYAGAYVRTGLSLPPQNYSSLLDCKSIINSSLNFSLSTCSVASQRVTQQACSTL